MGATLMSEIPFAMIAPHEARAKRSHGQSLERLAERGGLAVAEALDVLEGRRWGSTKICIENEHYLINLVRKWRAANEAAIVAARPLQGGIDAVHARCNCKNNWTDALPVR
jgi:hypothetical protein